MAASPPRLDVVRIDYSKLAVRLRLGLGEVHVWLMRNGFIPDGVLWDAKGVLHLLRPNEILEYRHRRTDRGVTFIESRPGLASRN